MLAGACFYCQEPRKRFFSVNQPYMHVSIGGNSGNNIFESCNINSLSSAKLSGPRVSRNIAMLTREDRLFWFTSLKESLSSCFLSTLLEYGLRFTKVIELWLHLVFVLFRLYYLLVYYHWFCLLGFDLLMPWGIFWVYFFGSLLKSYKV